MGLFDFFRGKKTENTSLKTISLDLLETTIYEKKTELSMKEKELLNKVKTSTKSLLKDLEEKSGNVENIDLDQKKSPEKVKLVVKENLFYFTSNLKKLINNINNFETEDINKFVDGLNQKFLEFEKKSLINYEKATFLIGKELGDIKEAISIFFKNLNNDLNENKELFEDIKVIRNIEGKLKELKAYDSRKSEIQKNIEIIETEIENLKKENESFEKIIDKIKRSDSYKEEIDNEIIIHEKNQQYEKDLLKLREIIDFRHLANFFHSDEKIMSKLKCYKDNFKETFEANSNSLITLSKGAGLETDKIKIISDKISGLVKEKENLLNMNQDKKEEEIKKVLNLKSDIKSNTSEIDNLDKDNAKEIKMLQKIDENNQVFIEELKGDLRKLNINLIEN